MKNAGPLAKRFSRSLSKRHSKSLAKRLIQQAFAKKVQQVFVKKIVKFHPRDSFKCHLATLPVKGCGPKKRVLTYCFLMPCSIDFFCHVLLIFYMLYILNWGLGNTGYFIDLFPL